MDARSLRVLEYDRIRELLTQAATSAIGKELASAVAPLADPDRVLAAQEETSEACLLMDRQYVPLGGIRDVRVAVRTAEKGGVLEPADLLDIAGTLEASRRLRNCLTAANECPRLKAHGARLGAFPEIAKEIHRCVDDRGEVKDSASPELAKVRRQVKSLRDSILQRLERMVHSPRISRLLQEPIITVRHDRHCLPVRSEHKGQLPGIVHDASASGATVFVEPMAVVEDGNELAEAIAREREEVRKVLVALSALVGESAQAISDTLAALAEVDFIFARAALSKSMSAARPTFNTDGVVDLRVARHPLLTSRVVPVDVRVGDSFNALVLTGPNTGGKTVALKTVGLLTLMAQSGLHIPASPESRVPIFRQVFADIGDEQSIEQNLSTFSSHMSQIVEVIRHADANSLVLLDELGAGTDPAEGAALAKAILSELLKRGCRTVATTHSGELKAFAYAQPGIENACVEFDPVTLEPTYHVRIGLPGTSNAFAIAGRLGLPEDVVSAARQNLSESETVMDEAIREVERSQQALQQEYAAAAQARREAEEERARARDQRQSLEAQTERIIGQAQRRAEALLNTTREQVAEMLESLRRAKARTVKPHEAGKTARQARERLKTLSKELAAAAPAAPKQTPPPPKKPLATVRPGQVVFVRSRAVRATALSAPDERGEVDLQAGILKIKASLADLEEVPETGVTMSVAPQSAPEEPLSEECHLRGMRVQDALFKLEAYLERAFMAGLRDVRIVHGIGTGAVKSAALELLRSHPYVASTRPAEPSEGGAGATIATLVPR